MILVFLMLSFKPAFSCSSFLLIKSSLVPQHCFLVFLISEILSNANQPVVIWNFTVVSESFTNKFKIKLINYFCLCWVFWLLHGPSLVAAWEATLHCGTWASHYSGFFCCGAQTLGTWASVVSAHRLHSCSVADSRVHRLQSCGVWLSSCDAWA